MKRINDHIRDRLLASVHDGPAGTKKEPIDELRETEWSDEFETLMRNRLLIGRYRYGSFSEQLKAGGSDYDNVGSCIERLRLFQQTGNLEHLVDVANLCMKEFVCGKHPNRHFESSDDGVHVRKINE